MNANRSVRIGRGGIVAMQDKARERGDLLVWTVYDHPADFRFAYVARPYSSQMNRALTAHFEHPTLDAVRYALGLAGLIPVNRLPDDDPVIVETWI